MFGDEKDSENTCYHLVLLKPDIMETTNELEQILKTTDAEFIRILGKLHKSLETGMRSGNTDIAKQWLQERKLTSEITGACYNSGQIHHRKGHSFKKELAKTGFLKMSRIQSKENQVSYAIFGKLSIIFPLRNKNQEVINFYAIGINNNKNAYLNEDGIYPKYPEPATEKLFIVPTAIDAATISESCILKEKETVMSLFDGELRPQHIEAITNLKQLKNIVWIEYGENQQSTKAMRK
jgi:hypothetical protein